VGLAQRAVRHPERVALQDARHSKDCRGAGRAGRGGGRSRAARPRSPKAAAADAPAAKDSQRAPPAL
jgi:hypothetical protein